MRSRSAAIRSSQPGSLFAYALPYKLEHLADNIRHGDGSRDSFVKYPRIAATWKTDRWNSDANEWRYEEAGCSSMKLQGALQAGWSFFFFLKEEKFSCLSNRRRNLDSSLNVKENIAAKKWEELSPVSNYTFSSPSSSMNVFFFLNEWLLEWNGNFYFGDMRDEKRREGSDVWGKSRLRNAWASSFQELWSLGKFPGAGDGDEETGPMKRNRRRGRLLKVHLNYFRRISYPDRTFIIPESSRMMINIFFLFCNRIIEQK